MPPHAKPARMTLDRVAERLAVDGAYRERCRQRLQAAVVGGATADVLGRVRRLNEYLATGLVIQDEDETSSSTLAPLPWEQPPPAVAPPVRQQHTTAGPAVPEGSVSDSDSDIEDEPGSRTAGGGPGDLAGLLAAAQAAVERRRQQAALAIQCAFRRHAAQQLRLRLREQRRRQAAERLVARLIAGAYARVCGQQRCVARKGAIASLCRWRRWRWQKQRRHKSRMRKQQEAETAAKVAEQQQQQQQQGHAMEREPANPAAQPQEVQPASSRPASGGSSSLQAMPAPPQLAPLPAALPEVQAQAAVLPQPVPLPAQLPAMPAQPERVPTPAAAPCPSPPHSPAMRRTASTRGSSPALQQQQQQAGAQGCLQQCLAPPPRTAQAAWHCQPDRPPPPRTATLSSRGSGGCDLPPHSAGSSGRGATPDHSSTSMPPGTARSASHGAGACRRLSSIQLLEAVQLGIDGPDGSVASQAAIEVCERAAERVAGLQRSASARGTGSASRRTISRVGSTVQRQASRASGWVAAPEAIDE
ncbi:hypothetical protein ABPG75_008744 [Micractinium tetrahymenae]